MSPVSVDGLGKQLSEITPKLDQILIRIMPALEELRKRTGSSKAVSEEDAIAKKEDSEHIQKILDIVEDIKEERSKVRERFCFAWSI